MFLSCGLCVQVQRQMQPWIDYKGHDWFDKGSKERPATATKKKGTSSKKPHIAIASSSSSSGSKPKSKAAAKPQ